MAHPTADDIREAIKSAETGDWIDPEDVPNCWECILYSPDGKRAGEGHALTPDKAMGLAWLHAWAPDALSEAYVEDGSVPLTVPDGWRFELTQRQSAPMGAIQQH
jgi:hypothetical protein